MMWSDRVGSSARLTAVAGCLAAALAAVGNAQSLTVYAASSLTEPFERLAELFEQRHPGVRVNLNFAGSSTLALQIIEGAPADVLASADLKQLERVESAGFLAGAAFSFARNRLVVVTTAHSGVSTVADLANDEVVLVMAGPEVPAGRYARATIASLDAVLGVGFAERVMNNLASEERNVRLVAAKVALGEADAGIVYATDAAHFDGLRVLEFAGDVGSVASYGVAVLANGPPNPLARAFVALVLSADGARVLSAYGFTVDQ